MADVVRLPNGSELALQVAYLTREANGVTTLVVVSCISLITVVGLLVAISISAFNTRESSDRHLFVRTHVAAYFVSLLLCDLLQAIGSIMNAKWIHQMGVQFGDFCVLQGVLKQTSDVGTAFWTLVIAIHTFCLLFLQLEMRRFVLWATLIASWSGIAAIVISGPAALDTAKNGPFFSISGYWCWISPEYPRERITLDYMIMFIAAFLCFVIYTLIFLRLRGNIVLSGWHVRLRAIGPSNNANWRGREVADSQAMAIARQMLLYPVAYTILIIPIAASRFSTWAGHDVPFEVTIFSGTVFLLSGTVNVVLFTTTRRILPPKSISIGKWSISRPKILQPAPLQPDRDPYYQSSETYSENTVDEKVSNIPTSQRSLSYHPDETLDRSIPVGHSVTRLRSQRQSRTIPFAISVPQRNSVESMYSLYDQEDILSGSLDPPLTSHWSPDDLPTQGPSTGRR